MTNLGTLTWNVPHQGSNVLWEIGYPDRTAAEFRHGDDYATPALWLDFANEFPNPMTYTVGSSNWTNDWNYVQGAYLVNGVTNNMVWTIQFNLLKLPVSGNATLNTVWAGAAGAAIQVFVNTTNVTGTPFRDFYPNVPAGADTLIRQGIHDKYGIDHTPIPVSKFIAGTNTITLVQRRASGGVANYAMYDYLDFELPTPMVPAGVTAVAGDGQAIINWNACVGATGYYVSQSTANGGPYKIIGANVSSLALTNTGLTNGVTYYYLVSATNSFGASDVSAQVSARPVSNAAPQLGFGISAGQIILNWPADHAGWSLQMQTNSLGQGLGTDWVTVSGSASTNQFVVPFNSSNGAAFFRLVYP